MNNDLIRRSALLNRLAAYGNSERKTDYDNGWDDARDEIVRQVKYAEAVDAEPVRHGFWKAHGIAAVCSECGESIVVEQYDGEFNFCMNCGAKMGRGANDD